MDEKGRLKRKIIQFLTGGFLAAVILAIWQYSLLFDGKLHLTFCDVGQGDAIYLRTPKGADILIDGGPNNRVLSCLSKRMPFWDRQIEMLVLTHPQADHLTGLVSVLENYRVKTIVLENIGVKSAVFNEFRQKVEAEKAAIRNPQRGDKIKMEGIEMEALWPKEVAGNGGVLGAASFPQNPNEFSIIFDIKYKDFDILTTGDVDSQILKEVTQGLSGKIEVFQVPHHGSKFGLTREILEKIAPDLAVVSVGENNRFGHPAPQTMKILKDKEMKILRTDKDGSVEIISDGKNWWVETED